MLSLLGEYQKEKLLGIDACAYNSSTWDREAGRLFEASLSYIVRSSMRKKHGTTYVRTQEDLFEEEMSVMKNK
jgi:hypothetical protein